MRIGTAGIITNEYNHILLIQRDDTRTWCEPGGSLEFGRLPTDNVAQEVREETGMIVMPVRLVALHHWNISPDGGLSFIFRCLIRGGELTPSPESPQVGFYPSDQLPRPILDFHQQSINDGWHHKGGPPIFRKRSPSFRTMLVRLLLTTVIYPFKNLRLRLNGEKYTPPPQWELTVAVVAQDEDGRILWQNENETAVLPHGRPQSPAEAPWETAARLIKAQTGQTATITDLPLVVVTKDTNHITLIFSTHLPTSSEPTFTPAPPPNANPLHISFLKDALNSQEETIFRYDTP